MYSQFAILGEVAIDKRYNDVVEHRPFTVWLSPMVKAHLAELATAEQTLTTNDIEEMRNGEIGAVHTKQLRGPIRELIVGNHRFTYFQLDHMLYFVRGFRKKSRKTPPKEIDYAMKIYKNVKSNL